jgi:transcriptional regulator with XRE-family HTH domain
MPPPGESPATAVLAVCAPILLLSTVVYVYYCVKGTMEISIGTVLRQAREVRGLSSVETARGAGISAAYLSKLENDAVKRPSPAVLHRLGEVLSVPYVELMVLVGHPLPSVDGSPDHARLGAAMFADLTDDERDELIEYLAWYRTRKRPVRRGES